MTPESTTTAIRYGTVIGEAVEWRRMPNGEVKCLAFVELGTDAPTRCDKTQDMFEGD